jgi:hypothetical protein
MAAVHRSAVSNRPVWPKVARVMPPIALAVLYVQPATLPAGPFLAYDRNNQLVSTIYMIPLEDIEAQKKLDGLAVGGENVESVDLYYNAGHPGVEKPHYHVVLWHVPGDDAELE